MTGDQGKKERERATLKESIMFKTYSYSETHNAV